MISDEELDQIAVGWIEEFSVDPYVLRQRETEAWSKLDRLIYDHPRDALRVFESMAQRDMINWTFEGVSAGPLRTFLMLYSDRYDDELNAIRKRISAFDEMHVMAAEGMG